MAVSSRIIDGKTTHIRFSPTTHEFTYPVTYFCLNVDELSHLGESLTLFSYNGFNIYSIHDTDYLFEGNSSIKQKITQVLHQHSSITNVASIYLITCPKYFGRIFNPVSFYFLYDNEMSLLGMVAEVSNTYHERHLYICEWNNDPGKTRQFKRIKKAFHVSPFFNEEGHYDFKVSEDLNEISIDIMYYKGDEKRLYANLKGPSTTLSNSGLLRLWISRPFQLSLTMPRILIEAGKLYYLKKISARSKPIPEDPMTIRTLKATKVQRLFQTIVLKVLARITWGELHISLPGDDDELVLGSGNPGAKIKWKIKDYEFFKRLGISGEIGLGESYQAGEWETDDLPGLLKLFIRNRDAVRGKKRGSQLSRVKNFLKHVSRSNTKAKAKSNISRHYDLSNDMYASFLGESMMYSSGYFESPNDSLEEAQYRKCDMIIAKAKIKSHHHVLEIGSGWGSMAIRMAEKTGCKLTSITISKEQHRFATDAVKKRGLSDRVSIEMLDYRDLNGQYDRIVSIEMIEAVGHNHLETFFKVCDRALTKDGIIVMQAITLPDQRYADYLKRMDWIQKYIFPGGHLPSIAEISRICASKTQLIIDDIENFPSSYALTLKRWRDTFLAKTDHLKQLGFDDRFIRTFEYYFAYCEAGFALRYINTVQLVFTRAQNDQLIQEELHEEIA